MADVYAERRKNIKQARYRGKHKKLRKLLESQVLAGLVDCWRCGERILPGEKWDLGHDDINPELHAGPEHARCNRGAPNRLKFSREW